MHASGKRGATTRGRNNGVAAGSVWDTRIRMDEIEGGVKVYNADSSNKGTRDDDDQGIRVYRRLRTRNHQSDRNSIVVAAAAAATATATTERRKRRNWKPPGGPITNDQLRKSISDLLRVDAEEEEEELEDHDEGESSSFDDKEIDVAIEKKKPIIALVEKEKEKVKVKVKVKEKEKKKEKEKIHDVKEDHKKNKETEITMAATSSRPAFSENYVADDKKNKETDQITMAAASSKPTLSENYVADDNTSGISAAQTRMLNIVDLVMWRDVPRSAFVFGFGSFLLVSSSYASIDLNYSVISLMSYLGLVYLAMIFLYKSILRRGSREFDAKAERCMIGEEEAIWVLRFLLPYINKVLLKIRALFSGDPATTMKLAFLLFVLARWGGSLSTWTLAKLVFFGVFTIPKLSSSYYVQMAKSGKFWLERFQDGWESCTHKKALAAAVFTLVWNISSTIARIWAVFMLVVAVKSYQQCVQEEQWNNNNGTDQREAVTMEEEDCREEEEDSKNASGPLQHRHRITGPRAEHQYLGEKSS